MEKVTHDAMTNTYRVARPTGGFDSYTPAQYKEKFGELPEEKDAARVAEETGGLETDSAAGSDEGTKIEEDEEMVTSEDGTVTVPKSEIEAGLKAFEDLSPEEQAKVKADQEAAESAAQTSAGQSSDITPESTSGVTSPDVVVATGQEAPKTEA